MFNRISRYIVSIFAVLILALPSVGVYAQTNVNAINLKITKVTKDGQTLLTQNTGENSWVFTDTLNLDDQIRYAWVAVSLDLSCKDFPAANCGYLRIYKNDLSTPDNFITEFGSSPLSIRSIADKLTAGKNKLVFVYVNSLNTNDVSTQVTFEFNYISQTNQPNIEVLKPAPNSLFAQGINRDFVIKLTNFELERAKSGKEGRGKIGVYYNDVAANTFLGTLSSSSTDDEGNTVVTFSSQDLDFTKIPDAETIPLVFQLTDSDDKPLPYKTSFNIKSNYQGTINVGLPSIKIVEPRKDRSDPSVDANQTFVLEIENFEVLDSIVNTTPSGNKGYVQILVDDAKLKIQWSENTFTLNSINASTLKEGRKQIKVKLVNEDFTDLVPAAEDTIDIIFTPAISSEIDDTTPQIQTNTWRIVVVILTVVFVVGGVAVLITKG